MQATPSEPETTLLQGFAPLSDARARVLVLGSMPGTASLRLGQYYGHARNAFWPIMGALFGFDAAAPYAERVAALLENRVAVWDVLAACERPGSLDADIVAASTQPNDFAGFFSRHRGLVRICCNGATAHHLYLRHIAPHVQPTLPVDIIRLPSTSPAYAGLTMQDKLSAWRAVPAAAIENTINCVRLSPPSPSDATHAAAARYTHWVAPTP